jgi:hypothetical protein
MHTNISTVAIGVKMRHNLYGLTRPLRSFQSIVQEARRVGTGFCYRLKLFLSDRVEEGFVPCG